jgi:hypothetical protein
MSLAVALLACSTLLMVLIVRVARRPSRRG